MGFETDSKDCLFWCSSFISLCFEVIISHQIRSFCLLVFVKDSFATSEHLAFVQRFYVLIQGFQLYAESTEVLIGFSIIILLL